MMRDTPVLSILITTFNRVKFLETITALFISQIVKDGLTDKVEIIIGNDASSDATEDYLNALDAKYRHQFVKTISHPQNLGYPGNLEKLTAAARGEYIWSFGEDDLIVPGAVKKVLQYISSNSPNYMLINTKNMLSLDDRNLHYQIIGANRLDIHEDLFVKNFEKEKNRLLKIKNWLYLTNLCSSVIYNKNLFLNWMDAADKHMRKDNLYAWQAAVIMGISKLGHLFVISEPLVLHRKNENHYSKSVYKLLNLNLYDAGELLDIIKKYMPGEHAGYQKRFAAFVLSTIVSAKKNGVNVNKYIIHALKKHYKCYPYNIRFLIALLAPGIIFRAYFRQSV